MRCFRASVFAFAVILTMSVGLSGSADAAPKWCEDDPIIVIGYSWAQVLTKFNAAYVGELTGPLAYDVYVPESAYEKTRIYLPPSPVAKTVNLYALPDSYWSGWKSRSSKVKLEVRVLVPASASFATFSDVSGTIEEKFRVRGTSNVLTVFQIVLH